MTGARRLLLGTWSCNTHRGTNALIPVGTAAAGVAVMGDLIDLCSMTARRQLVTSYALNAHGGPRPDRAKVRIRWGGLLALLVSSPPPSA